MPSAEREPSQSPPPAPPTASTPGPRAAAFNTLWTSALSNTLKSISYDSFADCFPTIAQDAPETLKYLHTSFISRLQTFATQEFNDILSERRVVHHLNTLDDLISSARLRRSRAPDDASPPTPPHTLAAELVMYAHLDGIFRSQQSMLNAKLQTVQSQNARLYTVFEGQQREIEELVARLEGVDGDLRRAGEVLGGEEGVGLGNGAREAEGVLGGGR